MQFVCHEVYQEQFTPFTLYTIIKRIHWKLYYALRKQSGVWNYYDFHFLFFNMLQPYNVAQRKIEALLFEQFFFYLTWACFIKNRLKSLFWSFSLGLYLLQHSAWVWAINGDNLAVCVLIRRVNQPPVLMRTAESDTWLTRGDNGAGGALKLCWRLRDECLCTLWVSWVTFDLAAQTQALLSITGRPVTSDPLWYLCSREQTWCSVSNVKLVYHDTTKENTSNWGIAVIWLIFFTMALNCSKWTQSFSA